MSEMATKSEDSLYRSPTNTDQVHCLYSPSGMDDLDNDISPESISVMSRKESHRASERKRRERLGISMNTLDSIIKQTRKFANKKNVKLDKNSIIEHAIAYIRELQQINEIYAKKLEEARVQISSLQQMLLSYNQTPLIPSCTGDPSLPGPPIMYNQEVPLVPYPSIFMHPIASVPKGQAIPAMQPSLSPPGNISGSHCFDSLIQAAVGENKLSNP